ncbi:MAG: hypothetical protein Q4C66_05795 [Lachnospiraceae bacterium]|nr:hypothetical protein [Lachnospiraceae bacterium]
MKRVLQRLGILFVIFIAAGAGYFYWMQNRTSRGDTLYISMEEGSLPVVYMDMLGREMNCLHGYVQEMADAGLRGSLTVLPEDRNLNIRIARCQGNVTGIYYEIRTLDQSRLIERTSVEGWTSAEDGVRAALPIQNLLSRDQEYQMTLTVDTDSEGAVRYYTRLIWTEAEGIRQMVDLAADFSAKTFHYEDARTLVTYLESDNTGDNTNLGHVDIHSSFSQITWGGLAMEPAGEVFVTLNELDGTMAQVTLEYLALRQDEEGVSETYEVEDSFTMRKGQQRVYMMDFDRQADQIFQGEETAFTGSRILLGVTDDHKVQAVTSENGKIRAFVTNHDLWSYDETERQAVSIFSFRSRMEEGIRPAYRDHAIKILRAGDNGDVDFLVYGYMNRGRHEGCMGIAMYRYSRQNDALEERFFAPVTESFEKLSLDMGELSYLSGGDMLYLKVGSGIYGVDLTSNEFMAVAEGLPEGGYAISQNGQRMAWQEGTNVYQSRLIHLMDLETGEKNEVTSAGGDCLRALGFVGNDFIYGLARADSQWVINGRMEELPMYALEILGEDMIVQTRYEKAGYYISGVSVGDSRIHLKRIVPLAGDAYQMVDEDTIVCNEEIPDDRLANIGWYADSVRQKLYFVQLGTELRNGHRVHSSSPERITYETSEILKLGSSVAVPGMEFLAYGGGHLLGITQDFSRAVELAYPEMGIVTDADGRILWSRVNRPSASTIRSQNDAASRFMKNMADFTGSKGFPDGTLLLDARGCSLSQVLYFLGQGYPVLAYGEGGIGYLLMGYDAYNVTIYQPETGESWKMGLNDATNYFTSAGNDFICGIFSE